MAKALVIVESPAKAKTINKYLGKQYIVKASLGHIKDLPKRDLAVDIEHGFTPDYKIIEGKKKLIGELKAANLQRSGAVVQNVGGIICAVLMFVFSVNLIRLLADFAAFASIAEDILRRTADLKRPTVEERDALSLMHDYQTARNSAPLLPTFIWHLNGEHLREQWALFRPKGKQLNSP